MRLVIFLFCITLSSVVYSFERNMKGLEGDIYKEFKEQVLFFCGKSQSTKFESARTKALSNDGNPVEIYDTYVKSVNDVSNVIWVDPPEIKVTDSLTTINDIGDRIFMINVFWKKNMSVKPKGLENDD